MADPVRYSDTFTIRCQPELREQVERAALARGQKPAEYGRQALKTSLRLDGYDPATNDAPDALTDGRAS